MSTLEELAGRVEQATGPDRELDALIFIAVLWPDMRLQTDCNPFPDAVKLGRIQDASGFGWRESPAYTASLNAAMTLVPDRHSFAVGNCGEDNQPWACVTSPLERDEINGCKDFTASAATPELALTAASLRARTQVQHD